LGEFTKALKKKEIKHYFNYPRYPKGQAYVERMNRTLQEEFVMYHEDYELKDIFDIINSNKSEFSQIDITYIITSLLN
jgi:transposase InsO family protein